MARSKRVLSEINQYHLISRGINKNPIFIDNQDYSVFISILSSKAKKLNIKIYAYCLMKNHYHILAGNFDNNLSTFMKMIGNSYVSYFNKKYERIGPLFQDRFKSEPVNDEQYFLTLIRYIHQNPEKAHIGNTLTYKWSSIKEYLGYSNFIDAQFVINLIGGFNSFIEFITKENDDICMEYLNQIETDEYAHKEFLKLLNIQNIDILKDFNLQKRNSNIRLIKNRGYPISQISRITGFSISAIKKA